MKPIDILKKGLKKLKTQVQAQSKVSRTFSSKEKNSQRQMNNGWTTLQI